LNSNYTFANVNIQDRELCCYQSLERYCMDNTHTHTKIYYILQTTYFAVFRNNNYRCILHTYIIWIMSNGNSKIIILRLSVESVGGCVGLVRKIYTITYICNIRWALNRFHIIRYVIFYVFEMRVFLLSLYFEAFLQQSVKSSENSLLLLLPATLTQH